MKTDENLEARVLIEKTIAAKEADLHKVDRERRAAWRKHQRTQDQLKALNAELEGLQAVLESLGGPTAEAAAVEEEEAAQ